MNINDILIEWAPAVEYVVTIICLVAAAIAIVSGLYLWYIKRLARDNWPPFLDLLFKLCRRVALAAAVTLIFIFLSLTGFAPGRPWSTLIVGLAFLYMLSVPSTVAWLWFRERRMNGDGKKPVQ